MKRLLKEADFAMMFFVGFTGIGAIAILSVLTGYGCCAFIVGSFSENMLFRCSFIALVAWLMIISILSFIIYRNAKRKKK